MSSEPSHASSNRAAAGPASSPAIAASDRRFTAFTKASGGVFYQMNADWSQMQPLDGRSLVASNDAPIRDWLRKNVPESEHEVIQRRIAECIANKSVFELEHRVFGPERTIRWTSSRAVPVIGEAGEVEEWIGIATDVTDRKMAEEQLRRGHDTFYHLIQNDPFGVYVVDADFCLREVSLGAQKVFAHVPRPLIGRDFAEVLRSIWAEPFADEAIALFRHTLATGEPFVSPRTIEQRADIEAVEAYDWRIQRITLPDGRYGVVCYFYDLSERQRWEAALRKSEEQFRLMADAVPQIVWITDSEGRVKFFNQQWSNYTGIDYAFATANDVAAAVIHPEDSPATTAAFGAALLSGQTFAVEHRIRSASGAYRWFLVRGEPFRDPQTGVITSWFGASVDIHDRKQAEQALQASEARFRFLSDLGEQTRDLTNPERVMAAVARTLGEHLRVSRCAYAEVEADSDEFTIRHDYTNGCASSVGTYRLDLFGPRAAADQRAGRTLVIQDVDRELAPAEGGDTFNAIGIKAIVCCPLVRQGRLMAMMAVHQLTPREWTADEVALVEVVVERSWAYIERARAGRAVEESEARFRQLADAMPQMVWVTRPDGFHEYYNRRWYEFTGVPAGSTDGAGWNGMFHPDDQDRAWAAWRHSLATGEPYEIEYRLRDRNGQYRWTLGRALPIKDAAGMITRWFGTCTDIDAIKRMQQEREHLLDSERSARSEAERASRMKDEFLATLSHELRTPLNAILGWAQIIKRSSADPDDVSQGIEVIERNARAQSQIIEDLLDMSRIISGKVHLDVHRITLEPILRAAVASAAPAAAAKGIRIESALDSQAGPVNGDPSRLQQVFWNLLTNAVKFTPKGGHVTVLLGRAGANIELSVIDSGEGISAEFLPHVFDRFRQADASTTRRHGGLGLGLSIVKQLVELHGGTIRVKSDGEGQGSTFTVTLPPAVTDPPAEPVAESRRPQSGRPARAAAPDSSSDIAGVKVLIVDDEADARALVRRLLEDAKAVVRTAGSAAEAFESFQEDPPDVLVSDIGMPAEDGFALIRRVRQLPKDRGGAVPAAALTAYAQSQDRVRVMRAGFQTFLVKPVDPAELLAAVAALSEVTRRDVVPNSEDGISG